MNLSLKESGKRFIEKEEEDGGRKRNKTNFDY